MSRPTTASRTSRPATCSAPRSRTAPSSGSRSRRSSTPASSSPTSSRTALVEERLSQEDALAGFVLDGFPRNLAQADTLDAMLAGIGSRRRRRPLLRSRRRDRDRAHARARRGRGPHRRHPRGDREAARDLPRGDRAARRALPCRRASSSRSTRSSRSTTVYAEIQEALRLLRRRRMIIRKGAEEIDRIAVAGALVAATIDHVGRHLEPGITTAELDDIADAFIRDTAASRPRRATRATPRRSASRRTRSSCTASPAAHVVAAGDVITIDVGVTVDGSIADSAYTFGVGEITDEAVRLLTTAQRALRAGIAQAHARQPRRRHLERRPARRRGRRLRRRPQPRRARRRPLLPRGSAHPELRPARPRPQAGRGDDDRDRADDHRRGPRRARLARRLDDRHGRRLARARTSSTRWRSRPPGPGS